LLVFVSKAMKQWTDGTVYNCRNISLRVEIGGGLQHTHTQACLSAVITAKCEAARWNMEVNTLGPTIEQLTTAQRSGWANVSSNTSSWAQKVIILTKVWWLYGDNTDFHFMRVEWRRPGLLDRNLLKSRRTENAREVRRKTFICYLWPLNINYWGNGTDTGLLCTFLLKCPLLTKLKYTLVNVMSFHKQRCAAVPDHTQGYQCHIKKGNRKLVMNEKVS